MELKVKAQKENLPVYVLGFHVDYWNYLGWPDPFSKAEYSVRQHEYAQKMSGSSVYTPQVIVNGQEAFGGYDGRRLEMTVQNFLEQPVQQKIEASVELEKDQFVVSYKLFGFVHGDLLRVAVVEDHLQSDVKAGENSGKLLKHAHVVRAFHTTIVQKAENKLFIPIDPQWVKEGVALIIFLQNPQDFRVSSAILLEQ